MPRLGPLRMAGSPSLAPKKAIPSPLAHGIRVATIAGLGCFLAPAHAADPANVALDPVFDSSFLQGIGQGDMDLSRFSRPGAISPGTYLLDVTVNGKDRLSQKVRVISHKSADGKQVTQRFCFSTAAAKRWGAKLDQLPDQEKVKRILESDCIQAQELIPGATFNMDASNLSAELSIPQLYAGRVKRGYVDPSEWDAGINAAFVGYRANAYRNEPDTGQATTDYNATVNSGLNVAGWRLRHNGSYQRSTGNSGRYVSVNSYAQTDIDALQSQLTAGEYYTPGEYFESVPFTGVQVGSDDSMLPESERGFAPVVRGTAESNAKVTIRQSNNVIYETSVAPGPFEIDDLYSTGYAGDLEVTVTEADGREKTFTVPYSSVVQMLRPGSSRFNLAAGRYRDDNFDDKPWFSQGTYRRGISNRLTVYGGGTAAQDYASVMGGAAFGTPIGAIALDVTQSQAKGLPVTRSDGEDNGLNRSMSGKSYRVSYSKLLDDTGTNFSLAAYRFSSEGFLTFGDFARLRGGDSSMPTRERNRFQVTVSQSMGALGSLSLTGLSRNYWGDTQSNTTFQANYSKGFSWGSVSLSAGRETLDEGTSSTYLLSVSVPLGQGSNRPTWNSSASFDSNHNSSMRTGLSGAAGDNGQVNYGVYANRSSSDYDTSNTFGGNGSYRNSVAQVGASYSQSSDYKQYSASVSGTVLAYGGGMVFSPDRSETMALVEAQGAQGAAVSGGQGNRLDGDGLALKSGLTPYRSNTVAIDPKGLPDDVELEATQQQVVPRRGAIVKLEYPTVSGTAVLLQVQGAQGHFGAQVLDAKGQPLTMVGQGGLVFLRGVEAQQLKIVWGDGENDACLLDYQPPQVSKDNKHPFQRVDAQCVGTAISRNEPGNAESREGGAGKTLS